MLIILAFIAIISGSWACARTSDVGTTTTAIGIPPVNTDSPTPVTCTTTVSANSLSTTTSISISQTSPVIMSTATIGETSPVTMLATTTTTFEDKECKNCDAEQITVYETDESGKIHAPIIIINTVEECNKMTLLCVGNSATVPTELYVNDRLQASGIPISTVQLDCYQGKWYLPRYLDESYAITEAFCLN